MTWQGFLLVLALVLALALTVPALGRYFANVYGARPDGSAPGDRIFSPLERFIYRVCGIDDRREQRWNVYTLSLLAFSLLSVLALYALQRAQGVLFFNPTNRPSVPCPCRDACDLAVERRGIARDLRRRGRHSRR